MSAPEEQQPNRGWDGNALSLKPSQLLVAALGHILVGTLLIFGVQCSPKPPEEMIIQAVLLEEPVEGEKPVTVEEAVKPKPAPPKPTPPKPEPPTPPPPKSEPVKPDPAKLKQQAEAAEQKLKAEASKREQEQLLAKVQAEEKIRQAETKAKLEAETKAKREAEELARQSAETARKAAEEEARRVALNEEQKRLTAIEDAKRKAAEDAENKRKAEEKARAQALAAQLAAEENARMAAIRADSQKLWVRALSEAIRRNWLRPPGADNFSCKLNVKLQTSGQVVSATVISSCGSPVLDDSVIKAVYKASPLPLPTEPSAFVADLNLTFKP